jgi:peptidoglycan/LPS O-acetylase OafA/YrhL
MSLSHFSHPTYRPDIDGLRAIAVLSVVAFHAFPEWMKGGFIGVDVFFVISGYLISTIVFQNLERGTFSFAEFYERRVKRIFPALVLVLATCWVFGWFALLGGEYMQLGTHIAAGAGFVANLVLWNEAGYFDNAADTKPLLHLWSLGVEEQFYIVWPVVLWFAYRKRLNLLTLGVLIAAVSFWANTQMVRTHPVGDFYSPQTRFWELMLGSLLAWLTLYRPAFSAANAPRLDKWLAALVYADGHRAGARPLASVLSVLAALLLAYGFWRIDKDSGFPGAWAAVPVLSAVLLIFAGPGAWVNRVILSNRLAVWFGLISFPLYLWHWPLLAFARIVGSATPSQAMRCAIVLSSILLAWLTYRVVEHPVRTGAGGRWKVAALVALLPVVGFVGYNTSERYGLPFRQVVKINASLASGQDGGAGVELVHECGLDDERKALFFGCFRDPRGAARYALIGDSKSGALWPGVVRTSTAAGRWLTIGGNGPKGGSVPVVSADRIYGQYQMMAVPMIDALVKNASVETVVVATSTRALFQLNTDYDIDDLPASNNAGSARRALLDTTGQLVRAGKKVVFVVDNPTLPHPEDCLDRITALPLVNRLLTRENPKCTIALDRHLALSRKYRMLLNDLVAAYPNDVALFDTMKILCDEAAGQCGMRKGGRFMYGNTDHISDYAAGLVGKELNRFLNGAWTRPHQLSLTGPD